MSGSASSGSSSSGARTAAPAGGALVILVLALVLFVLHQDLWWWDDPTLVFGFLPLGLAYHALYSILAACLWALACKIAWPHHLEAMADESDAASNGPNGSGGQGNANREEAS